MRNLKINLILNILLSVSTVSMMMVNNISLLVLDLTGNPKLNLLLFLIVCFGQTIAFIFVVKYSLIPAIGLVRNTKELKKLEQIDNMESTSIYKINLTDCLVDILSDSLPIAIEGIDDVEIYITESDVKSTSQILVDGAMVSLESDRVYPSLSINYLTNKSKDWFSVVLDNSNRSRVITGNSQGVDLKILEHVYQVICDLTRTDINIMDFADDNYLIKCRLESEVFKDYKTYLTRNLVFKENYEKTQEATS